jgi:hypothetical protein
VADGLDPAQVYWHMHVTYKKCSISIGLVNTGGSSLFSVQFISNAYNVYEEGK